MIEIILNEIHLVPTFIKCQFVLYYFHVVYGDIDHQNVLQVLFSLLKRSNRLPSQKQIYIIMIIN